MLNKKSIVIVPVLKCRSLSGEPQKIKIMKSALHIVSSARGSQSYSRGLSAAIVKKLKDRNEIGTVVERDLTREFPPFLDQALIGEFYKHPETVGEEGKRLLKYSNAIFNEISNADIIVISTPMHNLGMSAPLKAWMDQLVRFGLTYVYDSDGMRSGRLQNKKVYLAIASGGQLSQWPDGHEFIESYVKAVFSAYAGITDVCTFRVEGTAGNNFTADYEDIIQNL
jgi:FMN-dependent NADH-azoreductase